MVRKNAISLMLASKKEVSPLVDNRKNVRAKGAVVRSTKVMITERRDVPYVHAVKNYVRIAGRGVVPASSAVKDLVKIADCPGLSSISASEK